MLKKIIHFSSVLCIICAISIFGVSLVYSITFDTIEIKEKAKKEIALGIILKGLKVDPKGVPFVHNHEKYEIFLGRDPQSDAPKGWGILVGEQGYSSTIQTMVGVDERGEIIAIEIVFQQETPGLGAECTSTGPKKLSSLWESDQPKEVKRPWFQNQFSGRKSHELKLKQGIDVISGATITSAAVARSVSKAVEIINIFRQSSDKNA